MFVWALSYIPQGGKKTDGTFERSGSDNPEKEHCLYKIEVMSKKLQNKKGVDEEIKNLWNDENIKNLWNNEENLKKWDDEYILNDWE